MGGRTGSGEMACLISSQFLCRFPLQPSVLPLIQCLYPSGFPLVFNSALDHMSGDLHLRQLGGSPDSQTVALKFGSFDPGCLEGLGEPGCKFLSGNLVALWSLGRVGPWRMVPVGLRLVR